MSTKHVFDDPDGLVLKALRGAVALNPDLRLHAATRSVYTKTRTNARVALISGGGAGHEPAHAGYTGRGMLAASVSGDIFASPSASQILTCIQLALAAQETNKVLLIINNYTGDRFNFGLAAERALGLSLESVLTKADLVEVETMVVADDVSLVDRSSLVGARGLAGNILVCKILGAAAESGFSLSSLKKLGDSVVANLASIGVGLAHCHVPGRKTSPDDTIIEDGMCELGLGLHNEPGVCRMEVDSAKNLVGTMLEQILSSTERKARSQDSLEKKSFLQAGEGPDGVDEVVLYVNNLGGMSVLEMSAIVDETISQLESRDIYPSRVLLSSYMTSLNAPGFSLSLLNLSGICRAASDGTITTSKLLSLIDFPTEATAWSGVRTNWPAQGKHRDRASQEEEASHLLDTLFKKPASPLPASKGLNNDSISSDWARLHIDPERIKTGIRRACIVVLNVENDLTRFDTIVGDGDCGATFSSGARAVMKALDEGGLNVNKLSPAALTTALSELLLNAMGGTSGALFGLYFTALSNSLSSASPSATSGQRNKVSDLESAPLDAFQALSAHTPARPGDRTLVDALLPFCSALALGEALETAVQRAQEGAESTRGMRAKLGRATYVRIEADETTEDSRLPPDPGAWGVAALLQGFVQGLRAEKDSKPVKNGSGGKGDNKTGTDVWL